MNYQKEPPIEVLEILKRQQVRFCDLSYFAWPQTFSSTAGPRPGIGGQSISTFTVEAYVCDVAGPTVYHCAGMYAFSPDRFEMSKQVRNWKKLDVLLQAA